MRPEPKKRFDTQPTQRGLNAAFSHLVLDTTGLPTGPESAPAAAEPVWRMGRVILRRETARRGGKTVLVVHDFATHLPLSVIERVAKKLRQTCGCGGTVKERTIEMQLDQADRLRAALEADGFDVAGVR